MTAGRLANITRKNGRFLKECNNKTSLHCAPAWWLIWGRWHNLLAKNQQPWPFWDFFFYKFYSLQIFQLTWGRWHNHFQTFPLFFYCLIVFVLKFVFLFLCLQCDSLEDSDITILRLFLWLCLRLDLMQGQRVWALSKIWVKEFDIGGHIAKIIIQIFCWNIFAPILLSLFQNISSTFYGLKQPPCLCLHYCQWNPVPPCWRWMIYRSEKFKRWQGHEVYHN